MNTQCNLVRDLLPLYLEDMVHPETADYIQEHLRSCPSCRAELEELKKEDAWTSTLPSPRAEEAKPLQRVLKRLNRQFYSLSYAALIFLMFLGFGWTGGEHLMYNSLIMPLAGIFGYAVFRLRALYKVPLLLLAIDLFVWALRLVALDLVSTLLWTGIYSLFVLTGIAIAFLLHFAFRKEKKQ